MVMYMYNMPVVNVVGVALLSSKYGKIAVVSRINTLICENPTGMIIARIKEFSICFIIKKIF